MKDKVAIVTGGGGGIGRASAELLAAEGAKVVIVEYNKETGQAALDKILADGGEAIFIPTDVSDEDQMKHVVETTIAKWGKIDVLLNNVGGSTLNDGRIHEISNDEFWLKMKVDVFGTWLGCRHVLPHMMEAGSGSVINMTSVNAIIGVKGRNAYAAAKGAIASLTRALAVEYGQYGIRVNCIAPGRTLSERVMARAGNRKPTDLQDTSHLLGVIEPAELARTVLYLATEDSCKTTGQTIVVDSGLTVQ